MSEKRTYFEVERDPDPNMTDAVHKEILQSLGAPQNMTLRKSGDNIFYEGSEILPPFWVVTASPTPI